MARIHNDHPARRRRQNRRHRLIVTGFQSIAHRIAVFFSQSEAHCSGVDDKGKRVERAILAGGFLRYFEFDLRQELGKTVPLVT